MPNYKLKNDGLDCGNLTVTNASGSPTWNYQAPGGSSSAMNPQPTYTSNTAGSTAMNPSPNDTLVMPSTFSTSVNSGTQSYPGTATYAAAVTGPNPKKAGYYKSVGITAAAGDWDASDPGTPMP